MGLKGIFLPIFESDNEREITGKCLGGFGSSGK